MKTFVHILGLALVLFYSSAYAEEKFEEKYNDFEDAAVAQAKIWQSGGKAKPMMSSDGKIVFPFGQSMPKLTCSPTRACDVELQPGEKGRKVILGDTVNWIKSHADSIEQGKTIQHVIFQPRDNDLETNVIITTDHRTYHIKLFAPKKEGVYLNRIGFYYPEELVSDWSGSEDEATVNKAKEDGLRITRTPVSIDKLDFGYKIKGNADFKPIRVFNDGERVYMEMPEYLKNEENPVLMLLDEKDKAIVVNYRREEDPESRKIHYVVDKLFDRCELTSGDKKVRITWKKTESHWYSGWFGGKNRNEQ